MIKKMLVALALVAGMVGAVTVPTAVSAAPADGATTLAACSPRVTLEPPESKFSGTEVWARWYACFTDPGVWEVKLERSRWYGWQKLDSFKATVQARTLYGSSLSYHCDGEGTFTYRLNGRYDNSRGTTYFYSAERRIAC